MCVCEQAQCENVNLGLTVEHQSGKFVLSLFLSLGVLILPLLASQAGDNYQFFLTLLYFALLNKPNGNSFVFNDLLLCL